MLPLRVDLIVLIAAALMNSGMCVADAVREEGEGEDSRFCDCSVSLLRVTAAGGVVVFTSGSSLQTSIMAGNVPLAAGMIPFSP